MKFQIKNIKNSTRIKFTEKKFMMKKKISRFFDSILHWGHEKMTVMLIPHNEKKIFNFQISKFTFLFFIVLFGIVIATSAFAVRKNQIIKQEEEVYLEKFQNNRAQIIKMQKLSMEVIDLFKEIKPEIEELYSLTLGSDDIDDLWNLEIEEDGANQILGSSGEPVSLPKEIEELKRLQMEMFAASNTLTIIKDFVNIRNKVARETPSITPNHGHITSLFGWRRSPFGFGRDFHTGIDIAAPQGTPIRATADGIVELAGWGGGYGNRVKIKHEYGFSTMYAHCVRLNVEVGQTIKKGQVIAWVGQTGSSTGDHCHYEVRLGDVPINPYPYMRGL